MINSVCSNCGMTGFKTWQAYKDHVSEEEKIKRMSVKLTPEKRKEIVTKVESKLKEYILGPDHGIDCRCMQCFNDQLELIASGKRITWGEPPNA